MRSDECDSDEEEEKRNLSDQPLWSTGNRGDVVDLGAAVAAVSKNLNRNISLRAKSYKSKAKKYQLLKISTGEALS